MSSEEDNRQADTAFSASFDMKIQAMACMLT